MGTFNINITAVGGHGCDRKTQEGGKLYGRCKRMDCPDCLAHEFVQQLAQRGFFSNQPADATLTHWPGSPDQVIDDLLKNERRTGHF